MWGKQEHRAYCTPPCLVKTKGGVSMAHKLFSSRSPPILCPFFALSGNLHNSWATLCKASINGCRGSSLGKVRPSSLERYACQSHSSKLPDRESLAQWLCMSIAGPAVLRTADPKSFVEDPEQSGPRIHKGLHAWRQL